MVYILYLAIRFNIHFNHSSRKSKIYWEDSSLGVYELMKANNLPVKLVDVKIKIKFV